MNLYDLLKDHIGEIFYSPIFGNMKLTSFLDDTYKFPIVMETQGSHVKYCFTKEGRFDNNGECVLFPSEDQRDWNKWIKEYKLKIPKTWNELIKTGNVKTFGASTIENPYCSISIVASDKRRETIRKTPIEKSALALLKIHQLIEFGYGGYPSYKEWRFTTAAIVPEIDDNEDRLFTIYINPSSPVGAVFHTEELAEEFMSHPENIQLLKDYYMI